MIFSPPILRLCLKAVLVVVVATIGAELRAQPNPSEDTSKQVLYKITPSDKIRIAVFQESDLSVISRVDAKGLVNLPLLGEIKLAGLTVSDAEKFIGISYQEGRYLRNPQVTINIEEYAPREVSIQGYVRTPGRYPLPIESSMTLLDLVTRAGGFLDTAKGTAVTITRINADGTKKVFTIDVDSLIKGKDKGKVMDNSVALLPGDIVYVPERII